MADIGLDVVDLAGGATAKRVLGGDVGGSDCWQSGPRSGKRPFAEDSRQ